MTPPFIAEALDGSDHRYIRRILITSVVCEHYYEGLVLNFDQPETTEFLKAFRKYSNSIAHVKAFYKMTQITDEEATALLLENL